MAPDDQLENFMAQRMERQRMLFERPTTPFDFIIEEHVFRRRFGTTEQMRELFDHVLELTALRNVTLQIVPLEGGLHGCLDGLPAERSAYLRPQRGKSALPAL
ncbi:hypothetical protein HDA42_005749 [Streptomyces costaricanus]|uniref:DUF5753 domain-containing protein n=1 Tax=Streptomyces murinus TaxID=33900 RepID=A0A7W3NUF3_STRMR|nr:hypothetical protein [Streptomyces murinus]